MKYFCVSDIHGYKDILVQSLKEAGYNEFNQNHKIIVIGDMVDRGPNSKEVLEYIYDLHQKKKAIVILGNHDQFLIDFFEGDFSRTIFNILRNGHKITLDSMLGFETPEIDDEKDFEKLSKSLNELYPHIYSFLKELPLYHEIGEYIFVHGAVDAELEDWKEDTRRNFIWNRMYKMKSIPNRKVIVGHTPAVYCRTKPEDPDELFKANPEMFDIHEKDDVVHIDGNVHTTKKINVYTIEI